MLLCALYTTEYLREDKSTVCAEEFPNILLILQRFLSDL